MQASAAIFTKFVKAHLFWIVAVPALAIFYYFNSADSGLFLSCPFHNITGLDCPGCGSQRAFHELLHFHPGAALRYNALFVLAIPYVLVFLLFKNKIRTTFPKLWQFLYGKYAPYLIGGIILLFFIARNIYK